jgi:hypothetical protein
MFPSPSLGPPLLSPSPSPAFGPCGMPPLGCGGLACGGAGVVVVFVGDEVLGGGVVLAGGGTGVDTVGWA